MNYFGWIGLFQILLLQTGYEGIIGNVCKPVTFIEYLYSCKYHFWALIDVFWATDGYTGQNGLNTKYIISTKKRLYIRGCPYIT